MNVFSSISTTKFLLRTIVLLGVALPMAYGMSLGFVAEANNWNAGPTIFVGSIPFSLIAGLAAGLVGWFVFDFSAEKGWAVFFITALLAFSLVATAIIAGLNAWWLHAIGGGLILIVLLNSFINSLQPGNARKGS